MSPEFTWTPEMGEISGFGGGYEAACQKMVQAGVSWLRENPKHAAALQVTVDSITRQKSYGALQDACAAVEDGCSGAMVGASANHAYRIFVDGWIDYVAKMIVRTAKDRAEAPIRDAQRAAEQEHRKRQRALWDATIDQWEAEGPHTLERASQLRWRGLLFYEGGVHPDGTIQEACADHCRLARLLQQTFTFDFNGVTFVATPATAAETLVDTYWKGLRK